MILIISDIHDNLVNLEKCLNWGKANNATGVICCGDITNAETIGFMSRNFSGPITAIRGNMEVYDDTDFIPYKNFNYLGRYGVIEIEGKKIGLCHEPDFIDDVLKLSRDLVYIFYGHTHKPWLEDKDHVTRVNPGTLGGVFQKATFATWEPATNKIELKLLETLN